MSALLTVFGYAIVVVMLFLSFFWLFIYLDLGQKKRIEPRLKHYPTLAILIPAIYEGKLLKRSVESASRIDYPSSSYRIYVALNKSSTRETIETAKSLRGDNVYVVMCPMDGKSKVMNYVLRSRIREKLLLVLDADTVIAKDLPRKLAFYFGRKKVGCALAAVKVAAPKTIAEKVQKYEYLISILSRKALSYLNSLMLANGAGTMFRTSVVKKLGYFDEKDNPTEDLEIGLRILTSGYDIEMSPTAYSYTVVPPTFRSLFEQRKRWFSGFFYNIGKYRKELLTKENRGLGLFIVPLMLLSTFIGIAVLVSLSYNLFYPIALWAANESALLANTSINYFLSTQLTVQPGFFLFSLSLGDIVTIMATIIGLSSIAYSVKYADDDESTAKDTAGIFMFLFFYLFFLSFIWLYAAIAYAVYRKGFSWRVNT